ncbi:MAG: hypothetical protein GWP02_02960 [Desulfobulbaceae bacterium]|nr:hypothetical protein [Desulfobulbaceae bacterium]
MTRSIYHWTLCPGRLRTATLSLALLLALMPLASAEVTPDDPVVADVVRMLDAGIGPQLIRSWLDASGKHSGLLSTNDMIALSAANAPDELIELLLTQSASPVTIGALPPNQPLPESPPWTDGVSQPGRAAEEPAASPLPAKTSPPRNHEACCLVDFAIQYRATEDREGEQLEQPGRDLFLYMDGEFLARLESQGNIASRGAERFKSSVAPGEHTVRLLRQLHTRKRSDSWDHETTVSPSSIRFRIEPGAQWQLELSWIQSEFSTRKPLTWRWLRNGTEVSGDAKTGQFRERWPFLCEDVEMSRDSGAISGWRARDRLKACVNWPSLWPDGVELTRAQVLEDLRRFDFEPPRR